jgi:hypothetical protein
MNSRTPQTPGAEQPGPASELDVEATIKAKGLTAPRVRLEDLDAEIVDAIFHVFPGTTVTVCLLQLVNGFTVTGESACASPENFDAKLGRDIAYRNARDKLWSLLGFRLKDQLHAATRPAPVVPVGGKPVGRMGEVLHAAARAAHEVNRAYCEGTGDHTQVPWDAAPEWQRDSAIEGVRALLTNPALSPADLHASWCAHKLADGWVYGETKDLEAKTHPCLVDYDQLPAAQRTKDYLFRAAVLNAAHAAGWSPSTGPVVRVLSDGAAVSPDRIAGGFTQTVPADDVGAIAPELGNLTATEKLAAEASIGAATGRTGNADTFLEERRRRNLADKPASPAGRVDASARVGSTHIDHTPEKDA